MCKQKIRDFGTLSRSGYIGQRVEFRQLEICSFRQQAKPLMLQLEHAIRTAVPAARCANDDALYMENVPPKQHLAGLYLRYNPEIGRPDRPGFSDTTP